MCRYRPGIQDLPQTAVKQDWSLHSASLVVIRSEHISYKLQQSLKEVFLKTCLTFINSKACDQQKQFDL